MFDRSVEATRLAVEDSLIARGNVSAVYTEIDPETGDHVIVVGVESADIEAFRVAAEGSDLIPSEVKEIGDDGKETGRHVRVKVVETGVITIQDDGVADLVSSNISSGRVRHRPAHGGDSLGHHRITAGTLGGLAYAGNRAYLLSNWHVLVNGGRVGDNILQPGPADGGRDPRDHIAELAKWVPVRQGRVDAAIASPLSASWVNPTVHDIGVPVGMATAKVGMSAEKSGRTTGHTFGRVTSTSATVTVSGYPGGPIRFSNQIMLSPMSQGGDSGSFVFERGTRRAFGLLFAGSSRVTIANHMSMVLELLSQAVTLRGETGPVELDALEGLSLVTEGDPKAEEAMEATREVCLAHAARSTELYTPTMPFSGAAFGSSGPRRGYASSAVEMPMESPSMVFGDTARLRAARIAAKGLRAVARLVP